MLHYRHVNHSIKRQNSTWPPTTAQTALTLAFDAQEKVLRIRTFLHNIRPLLNQLVTVIPERDASTVPFSITSGSRLQCQSSNAWNSFRFTTLVLASIPQSNDRGIVTAGKPISPNHIIGQNLNLGLSVSVCIQLCQVLP